MNNIFQELKKFRDDRGLDKQSFDMETYLRKIYEEIFELQGFDKEFCKRAAETRARLEVEFIAEYDTKNPGKRTNNPFVIVDALCDMNVFNIEAVEQLGFNAEISMDEVQKEINSRDGEIINGKFEKFTDEISISKHYKANFHNARKH